MNGPLYFLDTNILVHLIREDRVGQRIRDRYGVLLIEPRPLISGVTQGELRSLALQWKWEERKKDQMNFFLNYFYRMKIDAPEVYEAYASIDAYSQSVGQTMGKNDVWIAASARVMGARLLTTDKDFDHLDPRFLAHDWIDPERDKKQSTN